jgi:hypothetical protein
MKNGKRLWGPLLAALLFGMISAACDDGGAGAGGVRTPDKLLPSGYKTLDYDGWAAWFDANRDSITDAEAQLLIAYIEARLSELTPGGRNFWRELIGTDVVLTDSGAVPGTIGGCHYDAKEPVGNGWHYNITDTYDDALAALSSSAAFGYQPGEHSGNNLKIGSALSNAGTNWVIFEIADDSYRLIKSESGAHSGVIWRKKD